MTYRRGDVVWVLTFPFTDLTATKKRPALIISNDAVNHTGDYILMMITSKIKTDSLSIEVNDSDYAESPLGIDSSVRVHKIFTLHESLIVRKETAVTEDFCQYVLNKINILLSSDDEGRTNLVKSKR